MKTQLIVLYVVTLSILPLALGACAAEARVAACGSIVVGFVVWTLRQVREGRKPKPAQAVTLQLA